MFNNQWSRRAFLSASLAGTLWLLSGRPAYSGLPPAEQLPEGRIALYNTHNRERLAITYRNDNGEYDPEAIKAINWILRCHYTGEVKEIDTKVIEYLNLVDKRLGGGHEIHIICGFRSPEYNSLLRNEGRNVAKRSLHMEGKAIDIAIPGVGLDTLRRTAMNLRCGGVGYYPSPGFVHVDSGSFRTW